jgi:branched-chain amino acid transport system ATP-binding protein
MTGQPEPEPAPPGGAGPSEAVPAETIPDGEVLLEAVNLTAGYGDLAAVRDANLRLHRGEIVAVVGPNGAGKTTTMNALVGELPAMNGEVRWLGRPVSSPLHRRVREGLGYVPEIRSIIMSMSCRDNLRLGRGDLSHALELFPELEPLLPRRAGLLSGGEQQMLILGRALAARPTALIVDELSLGLAPVVVGRLMEALRVAAKQSDCGVLLVEQQARRAFAIADRWYLFRNGRNVASGDTKTGHQAMEQAYLAGAGWEGPLNVGTGVVA